MHSLTLAFAAISLQLLGSVSARAGTDKVWVVTQSPPVDVEEMQLFAQSPRSSMERFLWFIAPGRGDLIFIQAKEIVQDGETCGFVPPAYRVSFLKSDGTWTAPKEVAESDAGELDKSSLPLALLRGNPPGRPMDVRFMGLMAIKVKQLMAKAPVELTGSPDKVVGFRIDASGFRMVGQAYEVINLRSAELVITNPN